MQVSLIEAAANLSDLVQAAIDGEEVILLNGDRPAIKFIPIESAKPRPKFGSAKGLVWMSDDFDEPLEEMKEYLELQKKLLKQLKYMLFVKSRTSSNV
jgi:antitoxin (DNA-binding transcriptional repressor) of toxin-antitoxin stability system